MDRLVIDGFGKFIGTDHEQIIVKEKKDGVNTVIHRYIPQDLRQVVISGKGSISTDAIELLAEHGVDVVLIDWRGQVTAYISPPQMRTVNTRREQYRAFDTHAGAVLVKEFINAKLHNMSATLGTLAKSRKDTFPRKVYFMKTLGIKIKAKPKMDMGKEEHEKEHRRVKERKTVYGFLEEDVAQVMHNLAVEDINLGLYGMVDTTIILKNGEVVPVDVKYTDSESVRINWKKQLTAYALLLESRFKIMVKRGFVYFPSKHKQIQIDIPDEAKDILKQDVKKIKELIDSEKMPNVSKGKQCSYCEMKKFCT